MSSISRVAANLNGLVQRLRQSHSTHPVELVAMSHALWPLSRGIAKMPPADVPLRILVLDSSFNPPTRAHLALINSPRPTDRSPDPTISDGDYDAKLLLLSVRNADKPLGLGMPPTPNDWK
ncbi:hypothetical protein BD779DRAFT_1726717 [Infundibulicybe gibba]|nr:hypothetical protein BD779DRAFT_1726717 [Infundibulicybe gibba]